MIKKGDILICIKDCYCNSNYNLKGRKYIIRNICVSGDMNVNVYVSTNYSGGVGVSIAFTLYKDYDKFLPHSKFHLYDYFVSLVEVREQKLEQLGL